jgi:small-conductance mechanosensitive channel
MDLFERLPLSGEMVRLVVVTLLVAAGAFVLSRVGRRLAVRLFDDQRRQYVVAKWTGRVVALLGLTVILVLWSPDASNLLTVLTIIGAGLAVALRDLLLSLAAWVRLALGTPYEQGDRIEVHGVRGDVVNIGLLSTALMEVGAWVDADQSTGRILHVPNGWIFQHAVQNYTDGFDYVWNEFAVTVTFQSDWEAARRILEEVADGLGHDVERAAERQIRRASSHYLVQLGVLTPYVYVRLAEHGVRLTLRHLTPARGRRNIASDLSVQVLTRFRAHGAIELAYPTTTVVPGGPVVTHAADAAGSSPPPTGDGVKSG